MTCCVCQPPVHSSCVFYFFHRSDTPCGDAILIKIKWFILLPVPKEFQGVTFINLDGLTYKKLLDVHGRPDSKELLLFFKYCPFNQRMTIKHLSLEIYTEVF